jgi:hypothetical protein
MATFVVSVLVVSIFMDGNSKAKTEDPINNKRIVRILWVGMKYKDIVGLKA